MLLSIIAHLVGTLAIVLMPQPPFFKEAAERRAAEIEAQRLAELERQRQSARFVFVQPRLPPTPPTPRADLSDQDSRFRTPEQRPPDPTRNQPFMRGNTSDPGAQSPGAKIEPAGRVSDAAARDTVAGAGRHQRWQHAARGAFDPGSPDRRTGRQRSPGRGRRSHRRRAQQHSALRRLADVWQSERWRRRVRPADPVRHQRRRVRAVGAPVRRAGRSATGSFPTPRCRCAATSC